MIHTIQFTNSQNNSEITHITKNSIDYNFIMQNFKPIKIKEKLCYVYSYNSLKFTYLPQYFTLLTKVNLNKLLNKTVINGADYHQAIILINRHFNTIFKEIELGTLSRVDYKADFKTSNKDLYIKLFKKTKASYRGLRQSYFYQSSVYFNSNSVNINIYDKEQERKDKKKPILPQYKNLLRIEVQLKNPKLRYIEQSEGIERQLAYYFNSVDRDYYLNKTLKPILYKGDYYNLYHASKLIRANYKPQMADKLIKLVKSISLDGITKVRNSFNNTTTFNSYIKKLEEINVNPILIPKQDKLSTLPNLFNFTDENIYLCTNYNLCNTEDIGIVEDMEEESDTIADVEEFISDIEEGNIPW